MNYFISYDIGKDKLRLKVSKTLERFGCKRVQYSVFFAPDFAPKEIERLRDALVKVMKGVGEQTDSVLCMAVEEKYMGKLHWVGENVGVKKSLEKPLNKLF
ncbi:MAG: CRISPR-associated endonuclease Cas2 [Chitinophagales bacterium]